MQAVATLMLVGDAMLLGVLPALVVLVSERRRRIYAEQALAESEERLTFSSRLGIFGLSDGVPSVRDAVQKDLRVLERGSATDQRAPQVSMRAAAKEFVSDVTRDLVDGARGRQADQRVRSHRKQLIHLTRVAMLGELSGAMAHELQQPLTSILCNAQAAEFLLKKEQIDVAQIREIIRDISIEDKHAGEVIHRVRALLLRGGTEFHSVEVKVLLDDVLAVARNVLTERNIQLRVRMAEDVRAVRGDRVELEQVLLNLVVNACDSMGGNAAHDRRLDIASAHEAEQGLVRISVLDHGGGINPGQLEQIFEPFFTTKDDGVGLGLAISRSIIAAHGGRLWAANRPEGGAAFHFTVPIAEDGLIR